MITLSSAFCSPLSVTGPKHRLVPRSICDERQRSSSFKVTSASANRTSTSVSTSSQPKTSVPDAGFIAVPGVTGTICTNLFPIPILGRYGWFLTVYDRDIASSVGPFVASVDKQGNIKLGFEPGIKPTDSATETMKTFNGIAAGNLNVKSILSQLNSIGKGFQLKFFERGQSEPFFQRRNEIHISNPSSLQSNVMWPDNAPTYRPVPSLSTDEFEVRQLFSGAGEQPKKPVVFEWFGMNLFPIFPLAKYSAFVCVWGQDRGSSSVAIDKRGKHLFLSNFDPLPLPHKVDAPNPIGLVAVRRFNGPVSDQSVYENHRSLLQSMLMSGSVAPESNFDFRIVIDNTPNTLTQARMSEIWIKLKAS